MFPAYTFTKFLLLAAEIRLKIWSMACRVDEPTIHEIESMQWHSDLSRSSTIDHGCDSDNWRFPAVAHVCQESRAAALKVYTCLPCSTTLRRSDHAWVNTLYNSSTLAEINGPNTKSSLICLLDRIPHIPYQTILCTI
jgi:hypothetical protein